MKRVDYEYRNLPIPGGGYVTGFLYSDSADALYIRTDIGGAYRFERKNKMWKSLADHVTMDDLSETFPFAIATDNRKPGSLYMACGVSDRSSKGVFAVSEDYGESFRHYPMPMFVHGNANGRGTGWRLVVDYSKENTLYYASGQNGLWRTTDNGASWEHIDVCGEEYMTFIYVSEDGNMLICGTAGVTNQIELSEEERYIDGWNMEVTVRRGHSMYISYDGGKSFEKMVQPDRDETSVYAAAKCRMPGLVGLRYAVDEKYFYVTYESTGAYSYVVDQGYSCDGGATMNGRVVRYQIDAVAKSVHMEEITPEMLLEQGHSCTPFGYSGIATCEAVPGLVICSTITREKDGDCVFLSKDYGTTWKKILQNLEVGKISFRAPYMRPECNGGHSIAHWLTDLKINPKNPNEAWFNTGTGVFLTENLLSEEPSFTDWCDGIEETVHLNVYAMPSGDVRVVDILGDLGGFAFKDFETPCDNSFADAGGNRYITCINADFPDTMPQNLIVAARGNWTGRTKGGLIFSKDQAESFTRLPMPWGINETIDATAEHMEHPNVNPGWVALSADAKHIVWSMADVIDLPTKTIVYTHDEGKTYGKCRVYDLDGRLIEDDEKRLVKVFSDRVKSNLFYGFGEASQMYISKDFGESFYQYPVDARDVTGAALEFPKVQFGLIDCANKTEVRGDAGRSGSFYMALAKEGLWKYQYDEAADKITLTKLTKDEVVYRMGLGLMCEGGEYLGADKAIYISGIVDGEYGFYRSFDEGKSFERLNTSKQMFGEINSMDADCREFGRFYIATGSRGIITGAPVRKAGLSR
ncbi:MAG: endoglucanase [Lachnospiraceae bacterium]|nr:endoglucanase [Lachnospiraceae bacterium]